MQILKYFIINHPKYVEMMKNCTYHYDTTIMNFHHLEGDVWSHTVLSYSNSLRFKCSKYVQWAILLHDIGRIYTRKVDLKKERISFGDFEGVSQYVALEILLGIGLNNREISRILKIIAYQYTIIDYIKYKNIAYTELLNMFKYEEELLKDLVHYVRCDLLGRIIEDSKVNLYDETFMKQMILDIAKIKVQRKEKKNKLNKLILLVGPPCSRKSTWIERNINQDSIVINRDNCVEEIGSHYGSLDYDHSYSMMKNDKKIKKEVDTLDELRENIAKNSINTNIIIDNPNLALKNRKEWIDIFRETHQIEVILFLTPFSDLIACNRRRAIKIKKTISQKGLVNKLKTFVFPLLNEGIDRIQYKINSKQ